MSSNMMPGDNSGAEPRPHDRRCASLCPYPIPRAEDYAACWWGHLDHSCDCDEIADRLVDRDTWEADAFAAWERNNG